MKKSSKLPDAFYDKQIERMSGLQKFPLLPSAQKEIRRAMRRITETDGNFLNDLITVVVDSEAVCPTPAELIHRAGDIRHAAKKSAGSPDCPICEGSGFITTVRKVALPGIAPYDAEFAAVCKCRGGANS